MNTIVQAANGRGAEKREDPNKSNDEGEEVSTLTSPHLHEQRDKYMSLIQYKEDYRLYSRLSVACSRMTSSEISK
jgi:hypothetical protein